MKKVLFSIVLSLILTACASNGLIGRGSGPATKTSTPSVRPVYVVVKKAPKPPTIVKTKTVKKNGRYGTKGQKPPKPTKSKVEW